MNERRDLDRRASNAPPSVQVDAEATTGTKARA
jgi:hypothetical protein